MAESVLLGLDGNDDIFECAYVESSVTKLPFFASKVCLLDTDKLLSTLIYANMPLPDTSGLHDPGL